ncbi:MAG: hypothetical protein G01um101448_866 [Parcubacteria group bacterium Gr01-1014_48]|nr:MAG: hypothetical protein Greene041614_1190 [Parcubacteria group bacterium Greene0416_14]TSC72965.1 MAG: hypothetical protein G01um101448_866 [Parcubacteria group bacterium Gr01-1014_48]TSC99687.1 MAG: hypothetical protein Greene101415_1128 [Parcubacteria group bacterium Greene1014_15]
MFKIRCAEPANAVVQGKFRILRKHMGKLTKKTQFAVEFWTFRQASYILRLDSG